MLKAIIPQQASTGGNIQSRAAGGSSPVAVPSAAAGVRDVTYVNNVTAGQIVFNLPAAPVLDEEHWFVDVAGNFGDGTHSALVQGNGNEICGAASQLLDVNYESMGFIWNGAQWSEL